MRDRVEWKTAPPLWRDALDGSLALDRPAILRFDRDDFMETFQAHLDREERTIGDYVARPETWREPAAGLGSTAAGETIKLYQPTHNRFYLVAGGLVCSRYGLPDKAVQRTCGESTFYVLRRLEPSGSAAVDPTTPGSFNEFGWVPGEGAGKWAPVSTGVVDGEERLPLFPMTYLDERRRRLLAGFVPVSARERYAGAVAPAAVDPAGSSDPAAVLALPGRDRLDAIVVAYQSLLSLGSTPSVLAGDPETLELFREAYFFALIDLAGFLSEQLPTVWNRTATGGARGSLLTRLGRDYTPFPNTRSWIDALHDADAVRDIVFAEISGSPAVVDGVTVAEAQAAIGRLGVMIDDPSNPLDEPFDATTTLMRAPNPIEPTLFHLVNAALTEVEATSSGAGSADEADSGPVARPFEGSVFVARFVYERPRCRPTERITVSDPTEPFRLAHFYDPDAPFRENRIVLPIDTSLEGLRKYPNAVKMEISAQLRQQMDRVQAIKLGDLDDGNIPGERPLDLGMVCSMSIPIITICALVLLMIIVSLLNIVFFWMPLFKICKPKAG